MSALWIIIGWGVLWTAAGAAIFAATKWAAGRAGNASVRHLAWVGAFAAVCLLPVFQAIGLAVAEGKPMAQLLALSSGACQSFSGSASHGGWIGGAFLGAWLLGTLWTFGRAMLAWQQVKQWRRCSDDYDMDAARPGLSSMFTASLDGVELRIARGEAPAAPVTWGARRPVIMLPRAASEWSESRLEAALLHELSHIRRFDNLTQLFALFVCAIHWFNPFFWRAAKRMEAEAEMAADDCVILGGIKPSTYATELLALAAQFQAKAGISTFAQTSMIKMFTLEGRLCSIIDPRCCRGPAGLFSMAKIAGVFAAVLLTMSLVTPSLAASLTEAVPKPAPSCLPPPPN